MIGVIGLGLIGGSLAKALNQNTEHSVYGYDLDETIVKKAVLVGAVEAELTEEILPECDIIIVALWPQATVEYISTHADKIKKGAIVLDCSGVKKYVCDRINPLAEENDFIFMGGHPMAGMAHSGFDHAKKALFDKASMILVPPTHAKIEDVEKIKNICTAIGFTNIQITTAKEHDEMIAFTSQLAHVVSNAYIKSPTAEGHEGFSAGSYKDLTRVAKLDENMWTELFMENKDNLTEEIDSLVSRLNEYSAAIKNDDSEGLRKLLREGREKKALIDKEYF